MFVVTLMLTFALGWVWVSQTKFLCNGQGAARQATLYTDRSCSGKANTVNVVVVLFPFS